MSEFAFALNGEPFEVPPTVAGWRVKRLKASGPPQVVYSAEGGSLTLPIDATMDDLRREAVMEGKYRLEPVGADNHVIANAPVGYVYVHKQDRGGESQAMTTAQAASNPLLEAMRLNSELAKTVIDRFPVIVDSMAGLVRSVGGIDLPTRTINTLLGAFSDGEDEANDVDRDDDDDNGEVAPKATGWAGVAEKYAPQALAALRALIENGAIKIPGGSGALLDCRLASAAGARDAAANAQGAQPAPGPRDPAPARGGESRRAEPSMAQVPTAPRSNISADTGSAVTSLPSAPSSLAELPADLPTFDAAVLAHLAAIRAGLSLEEQMLAQALMAKLSPVELRTWLAELKSLSVRDAIAEVRAILGMEPSASTDGTASPPTSGGAS